LGPRAKNFARIAPERNTMTIWKARLEEYIAARARNAEAKATMARAERVFHKLLKRGVDEDHAYKLAGVNLADRRSIAAYHEEREALHRIGEALTGCPTAERYQAIGAVLVITREMEAANDA
jgi:hypothetical protein